MDSLGDGSPQNLQFVAIVFSRAMVKLGGIHMFGHTKIVKVNLMKLVSASRCYCCDRSGRFSTG